MAGPVDLLPYGDRACLLAVADPAAVLAVHAALRDDPPDGLVELVPGARSVLVVLASPRHLRVARERFTALDLSDAGATDDDGEVVQLDVAYDGEDLDAVATHAGVSVEEVVTRHTAPTYRSAFGGFAPGFAYLTGLDPTLHVPRRDTPRTRVPAGSVAIADEHTAVYPVASPGGWSLLGRTDATVWDLDADPPARLVPGTAVRFVAVRA
jgi:KipI family sensor histidine kinase inhibitor